MREWGARAPASEGAAGAAGTATSGSEGMPACTATTLKEAAACTGRRAGVALAASHLGECEYRERALEFNYVTPENEMKWDVTEPTRNAFSFTAGDQTVDFALENGMQVKGHTGGPQPPLNRV